jgi:hypothetical protein
VELNNAFRRSIGHFLQDFRGGIEELQLDLRARV